MARSGAVPSASVRKVREKPGPETVTSTSGTAEVSRWAKLCTRRVPC